MERFIKPTYDELESYVENLQKQLADAQATIAALEETILKMGENAAVVAKDAMAAKEQVAALQADNRTYINERHENMKQIEQLQARVKELEAQHEDLAQRNRILRHRPDLPIERTEFHDQFAALQSQLTQRTAELQTARCDAVRAFVRGEDKMCLVCGAKEPCELNNDPSSPCTFEPTPMELLKALQQRTAELEAARGERDRALELRDRWQAQLDKEQADSFMRNIELVKLRALILALPKVEGEIEVSSGVYNFILLKHDSGTRFLCGQIETEQTAKAYAALLQHRQGMEG